MAYDGATFMRDDPQILLGRFADYVRPYPAKSLARMLGCSERTAENFRRATAWPNARHWRLIVRAFGRDVIAAVFDPEIDETLARLRREERELEERLDELRARRTAASGGLDCSSERRAPAEARSPLERDLFELTD
jgi:hypothetical protein